MMSVTTSERVFGSFIQAAREACQEVERVNLRDTQPLLTALIQLLREANSLAQCSIEADDYDLSGDDALPDGLKRIPDDLVFNVVFDPLDPSSICSTSLKDALGDIYKSLKLGLGILDREPQKKLAVFWEWRHAYEFHWGRHLLDAIRFLVLCKESEPRSAKVIPTPGVPHKQ